MCGLPSVSLAHGAVGTCRVQYLSRPSSGPGCRSWLASYQTYTGLSTLTGLTYHHWYRSSRCTNGYRHSLIDRANIHLTVGYRVSQHITFGYRHK